MKNNISLLKQFDNSYSESKNIIGCDEVGRGALAGPIVVCCLILKKDFDSQFINDSKKLTFKQRDLLFNDIKSNALKIEYIFMDNDLVDKFNPLGATKKAIIELLDKLYCEDNIILTDYIATLKIENIVFSNIKKGDTKSLSIAAASIIAKVTRDQYMIEKSLEYPKYFFDKNKGYGTKAHFESIKKYGITTFHRQSFKLLK